MKRLDSAIHPTHSCFDDALEFFERCLDLPRLRDFQHEYRICHGLLGEGDDLFAHAWVEHAHENGRTVWQGGVHKGKHCYFALELDDFHRLYPVVKSSRYSVAQAAYLNRQTGHYGPWRREYAAHCGRGHVIRAEVQPPRPVAVLYR